MEKTEKSQNKISATQGKEAVDEARFQELVESLPKERNLYGSFLYFYQGFWCPSPVFKSLISFQNHFQPLDNDIILVSFPKSGTTWLKSLVFTIVNRNHFQCQDSPLLKSNPHKLIPAFEFDVYSGENPSFFLENYAADPRIFSTHTPYALLPPSIKHSNCKIVYICRNLMDLFVSYWLFSEKIRPENSYSPSLEEAFEMFCQGICSNGPFFNHILGYWEAANGKTGASNKVLFLKYEDLREDNVAQIKKLAEFLGFAFSEEKEQEGAVEEVVKLCSFESLKDMEVNKIGKSALEIPNKNFFRKGLVGDWSNYLTPSMVERMEKLVHEKLNKTGLTFKNQLS